MFTESLEDLDEFTRKWSTLDEDGTTRDGRYVVTAGRTQRVAKKVAENVPLNLDRAAASKALRDRVRTALATGERKVFVMVYERDGRHPVDTLTLDGDPLVIREKEEEEGQNDKGSGGNAVNSSVAFMFRELTGLVQSYKADFRDLHEERARLLVAATIPATELEVRKELGYHQGWRDAVVALGPTLEKSLPALAYAYAASQQTTANGDTATPEGRLRFRVSALEREANLLLLELAQEQANKTLTPALQTELSARLGALLQRFMAAVGMGPATAPAGGA